MVSLRLDPATDRALAEERINRLEAGNSRAVTSEAVARRIGLGR
jgi:hypothetical protein